jgi:hypothetical protein
VIERISNVGASFYTQWEHRKTGIWETSKNRTKHWRERAGNLYIFTELVICLLPVYFLKLRYCRAIAPPIHFVFVPCLLLIFIFQLWHLLRFFASTKLSTAWSFFSPSLLSFLHSELKVWDKERKKTGRQIVTWKLHKINYAPFRLKAWKKSISVLSNSISHLLGYSKTLFLCMYHLHEHVYWRIMYLLCAGFAE